MVGLTAILLPDNVSCRTLEFLCRAQETAEFISAVVADDIPFAAHLVERKII
jgi:hypothetical protein